MAMGPINFRPAQVATPPIAPPQPGQPPIGGRRTPPLPDLLDLLRKTPILGGMIPGGEQSPPEEALLNRVMQDRALQDLSYAFSPPKDAFTIQDIDPSTGMMVMKRNEPPKMGFSLDEAKGLIDTMGALDERRKKAQKELESSAMEFMEKDRQLAKDREPYKMAYENGQMKIVPISREEVEQRWRQTPEGQRQGRLRDILQRVGRGQQAPRQIGDPTGIQVPNMKLMPPAQGGIPEVPSIADLQTRFPDASPDELATVQGQLATEQKNALERRKVEAEAAKDEASARDPFAKTRLELRKYISGHRDPSMITDQEVLDLVRTNSGTESDYKLLLAQRDSIIRGMNAKNEEDQRKEELKEAVRQSRTFEDSLKIANGEFEAADTALSEFDRNERPLALYRSRITENEKMIEAGKGYPDVAAADAAYSVEHDIWEQQRRQILSNRKEKSRKLGEARRALEDHKAFIHGRIEKKVGESSKNDASGLSAFSKSGPTEDPTAEQVDALLEKYK